MGYKIVTEYEDGTKEEHSFSGGLFKYVCGKVGEKLLGMTELRSRTDGFPSFVERITITRY